MKRVIFQRRGTYEEGKGLFNGALIIRKRGTHKKRKRAHVKIQGALIRVKRGIGIKRGRGTSYKGKGALVKVKEAPLRFK